MFKVQRNACKSYGNVRFRLGCGFIEINENAKPGVREVGAWWFMVAGPRGSASRDV